MSGSQYYYKYIIIEFKWMNIKSQTKWHIYLLACIIHKMKE